MGCDVPRDDALRGTDRWHSSAWAALGSAALLAWFATAMALTAGLKSPLTIRRSPHPPVRCCLHSREAKVEAAIDV